MEHYIHDSAKIAPDVEIGMFAVIGANVLIGGGSRVGHHAVIHDGVVIGCSVRIDDHAVIGKLPMKALRSKTTDSSRVIPPARIGDKAIIGTGAIVYSGATVGTGVLIADLATVREDVTIGNFTIIGANATIENRVTIGARCKIQSKVYLCPYSEIGDDCFLAPCVSASNDNFAGRWKERTKYFKGVTIKNGGRIAVNATILPGRVIGEDGMVGAGSVVTRDVEPGIVVCGNPAKPLRPVPDNQLLKNQED